MSTDLHDSLQDVTEDLTLDRPLGDVLVRGHRIRRHRRAAVTLCGTAAVGLAVTTAAVLGSTGAPPPAAGPGSDPGLAPVAAWGPQRVNLDGRELASAERRCRSMVRDLDPRFPAHAEPLAADERDGVAIVFYRYGGRSANCLLTPRSGERLASATAIVGAGRTLSAGDHVALLMFGGSSGSPDDPLSGAAGAATVSDQVDRLEVTVAGQSVEALVDDGVAMFWLPDGTTQEQVEQAKFTAYAADGTALDSGSLY